MKRLSTLLLLGVITLCAAPRQLLLHPEKADSWTGKVEFAPGSARKGKGPCFVLYGSYPTALNYKELIPVSPDKAYILKASFRTMDPALPASAYLGVDVFDKNKRRIAYCNLQNLAGTESVVVSAQKGKKFLIIRKFENFRKFRQFVVAFGARKDYSDIPNFDLSPRCKGLKLDPSGHLRVELHSPLQKEYAPGTPTRFHSPWNPGLYYLAQGWVPPGSGEERIVRLQGISTYPGATGSKNRNFKFWKGTAYVRPFIWFGNWNRIPRKGAKLLVDDFSFEEVENNSSIPGGK